MGELLTAADRCKKTQVKCLDAFHIGHDDSQIPWDLLDLCADSLLKLLKFE